MALKAMADSQLFTTAGYYSGNIVAVKMINKPYIYLTKEIIQELNQVPYTSGCITYESV